MEMEIILNNGEISIVDDWMYEFINQYSWNAQWSPGTRSYYAYRTINYGNCKTKRIMMSRQIMEVVLKRELMESEHVDHINHDTLYNIADNLRIVTHRQNQQNQKRKTTSKFPGVSWATHANKWVAKIRINGKQIHLGYFVNEFDAFEAYRVKCNEIKEPVVTECQ